MQGIIINYLTVKSPQYDRNDFISKIETGREVRTKEIFALTREGVGG